MCTPLAPKQNWERELVQLAIAEMAPTVDRPPAPDNRPAMGGRAAMLLACTLAAGGFMLVTTAQQEQRLDFEAVKQQVMGQQIQPLGTAPVAAEAADFAPNALREAVLAYDRLLADPATPAEAADVVRPIHAGAQETLQLMEQIESQALAAKGLMGSPDQQAFTVAKETLHDTKMQLLADGSGLDHLPAVDAWWKKVGGKPRAPPPAATFEPIDAVVPEEPSDSPAPSSPDDPASAPDDPAMDAAPAASADAASAEAPVDEEPVDAPVDESAFQ